MPQEVIREGTIDVLRFGPREKSLEVTFDGNPPLVKEIHSRCESILRNQCRGCILHNPVKPEHGLS